MYICIYIYNWVQPRDITQHLEVVGVFNCLIKSSSAFNCQPRISLLLQGHYAMHMQTKISPNTF